MVEEVLPHVPYVGLVFTIPKMLRPYFLWDRALYGELCRAAYAATRKFFAAQFPRLKDAVPAMIAVPQSWGTILNPHPLSWSSDSSHPNRVVGSASQPTQMGHMNSLDQNTRPQSHLIAAVLLKVTLHNDA